VGGVYWVMVADDPDFVALFEREYASQVRTAYLILGDEGLAREVAQDPSADSELLPRTMAGGRRVVISS
jgi:hypothetical protein